MSRLSRALSHRRVAVVLGLLIPFCCAVPSYGTPDEAVAANATPDASTSTVAATPATRPIEPLVPPTVLMTPHVAVSRFVSPPSRSVLLSGSVDVIYMLRDDFGEFKTADDEKTVSVPLETLKLVVDGEEQDWDPIRGAALSKRIHLDPGEHEVKIGDDAVRCVIALNEEDHAGPADWSVFRSHYVSSKPDRCGRCHEMESTDDVFQVGEFQGPGACLECHDMTDFEVSHMHVFQPLEACHTCHSIHGSDQKSLLRAPVRELCEGCHDPDH